MKERDFKGIWIPKEVWLNTELTIIEKVFLVEIDSLDNKKGCYASNKYFAEFFGISKGRCSQIITSLKDKGLIYIELEREGKLILSRQIRVVNKLTRVVRKDTGGSKYSKQGYLENDKDNNTYTNNTVNNINNRKFKKPTINEIKEYCVERKNNIVAEQFFDFYESKGWMIGKGSMKNWKASIRTWERNNTPDKGMNKVHKHLNSHLQAQELLKKQRQ